MTGTAPLLPQQAAILLPGAIEQHLTARVPVCGPTDRAAAIRDKLIEESFDSAVDIAVCDDADGRRLMGLIPVEQALAAAGDTTAAELMDSDPPVVAPGLNQEQAAWKAVQHGESSLAVVDTEGGFRGLVPPARMLRVLLTAHDEDLARLGGYLSSTATARHATEEPLRSRLWHRMPWLLLGLFGSAVAAWLLRGFEEQLQSDVRLAFFVPGVVYMADAIGTQTEALVIRGMSVGVSIGRVFRLEAATGLLIGFLLSAVTFPSVWLAFGSVDLAAAVAIALFAACAVATVVAMSLPWLMSRTGRDPAFGSGPLATVVQDLLSLLIYFVVAVALVA